MIDRVKFAMELSNELNMSNFKYLVPIMAEHATAAGTSGIQCEQTNLLADVYSVPNSVQYSVKTYKDDFVKFYMKDEISSDRKCTDFIIERRISGVYDPNDDSDIVLQEVLDDIQHNEIKSLEHYNVSETKTVLLGYSTDDEYFYFRLTEMPYDYPQPSSTIVKEFTCNSKHFMKFPGNRSSVIGLDSDGKALYEWIHPNNQTYTRCLKKKYHIDDEESWYFKIKKQDYIRPSNQELLKMIYSKHGDNKW